MGPDNVSEAVAIEIDSRGNSVTGPYASNQVGTNHPGSVHDPVAELARGRIVEQQIGTAIIVHIDGADDLPSRWIVTESGRGKRRSAPLPHVQITVGSIAPHQVYP